MGVPSVMGLGCSQNNGKYCDGNGQCVACLDASQCTQPTSSCVKATCTNGTCGMQNQPDGTACTDASGHVCSAGTCVACLTNADCSTGNVCQSNKCVGECMDGMKDGTETDVDCGGGSCAPCATGKQCSASSDCVSADGCVGGVCTPCVSNYAQACGSCGGSVDCIGNCTVATPSNYGQSCGMCGGTITCSGDCSVATPPNLGAACTSTYKCTCGGGAVPGNIACSGTCVPDPTFCSCCGKIPC
jgi:Cys-rich repeat protein